MTAATTNRRLLIAVAAVGVLAGLVGIGASIAGVDDDREETSSDSPTSTTAPPAEEDDAGPATTAPPAAEEEEEEEDEEPAAGDEAAEEAAEAQLEADAAVSRAEAEQIAQGQVAGPVDRAHISDEGGTVTWEVRIDGESGHTDVLIDATTGAIIEIDD
ncbi:MAG TPA: PepSY domain-containing protein [Iamia sp.]|nr:PepSY domain-containing protein [Iamia sp.]